MAKRLDARGMVHGRVEYRHAGGQGDGTLVDLTRQGCRIKGTPPLPYGTRLRLQLWLPDVAQPTGFLQALALPGLRAGRADG